MNLSLFNLTSARHKPNDYILNNECTGNKLCCATNTMRSGKEKCILIKKTNSGSYCWERHNRGGRKFLSKFKKVCLCMGTRAQFCFCFFCSAQHHKSKRKWTHFVNTGENVHYKLIKWILPLKMFKRDAVYSLDKVWSWELVNNLFKFILSMCVSFTRSQITSYVAQCIYTLQHCHQIWDSCSWIEEWNA